MMIEYKIVAADDYDKFIEMLTPWFENGWRPQGGISMTHANSGSKVIVVYAQAITRNKPPDFIEVGGKPD